MSTRTMISKIGEEILVVTQRQDSESPLSSAELTEKALGLIARQISIPPIRYEKDVRGKPVVVGGTGFLSVTHTDTLHAVAYAPFPIGIDAEPKEENRERVAHRFFSPEEKTLSFSFVWTAKEAVSKLVGEGISMIARIRVSQDGAEADGRCFHLHCMDCEGILLTLAREKE